MMLDEEMYYLWSPTLSNNSGSGQWASPEGKQSSKTFCVSFHSFHVGSVSIQKAPLQMVSLCEFSKENMGRWMKRNTFVRSSPARRRSSATQPEFGWHIWTNCSDSWGYRNLRRRSSIGVPIVLWFKHDSDLSRSIIVLQEYRVGWFFVHPCCRLRIGFWWFLSYRFAGWVSVLGETRRALVLGCHVRKELENKDHSCRALTFDWSTTETRGKYGRSTGVREHIHLS